MQGREKEIIVACFRFPESSFLAQGRVSQSCCVGSKDMEEG